MRDNLDKVLQDKFAQTDTIINTLKANIDELNDHIQLVFGSEKAVPKIDMSLINSFYEYVERIQDYLIRIELGLIKEEKAL